MHYVYLKTFAHIEVFESTFMRVYVWQCDNMNVFVKKLLSYLQTSCNQFLNMYITKAFYTSIGSKLPWLPKMRVFYDMSMKPNPHLCGLCETKKQINSM